MFTPMNSPSQTLSVPNALLTLLELPQALRCHSTGHLSGYYEGDASSHCTSTAVIAVPPGPHGARATAMTQCSSAVGGSIIVSPRSWTSSRRTSRGKCPAAQWPDEGRVQGSKKDHAQESLVAHVEKLCGVNAPLQQQTCSPCSLRGLGPAAAGADSPDAALRGSRQLQSRGLPPYPSEDCGFRCFLDV